MWLANNSWYCEIIVKNPSRLYWEPRYDKYMYEIFRLLYCVSVISRIHLMLTLTVVGYYMYISGGDGDMLESATLRSVVMPSIHENFADKCKVCVLFLWRNWKRMVNMKYNVQDIYPLGISFRFISFRSCVLFCFICMFYNILCFMSLQQYCLF